MSYEPCELHIPKQWQRAGINADTNSAISLHTPFGICRPSTPAPPRLALLLAHPAILLSPLYAVGVYSPFTPIREGAGEGSRSVHGSIGQSDADE